MTVTGTSSAVHFYDVDARAIACGVRGADHRSTKHPRGVTCEACLEHLERREPSAARMSEGAASGATA
jgi:hypothetical protein